MEAKRGHGKILLCDWWKRPCRRVDANAQGRRVTSVSQPYLSFLSNVPSTRLSHVCVRNLVSRLQTSSFRNGEAIKGKSIVRVFGSFAVLLLMMCLCTRPFAQSSCGLTK